MVGLEANLNKIVDANGGKEKGNEKDPKLLREERNKGELSDLNNITENDAGAKATEILKDPETEKQVNTLKNIMKSFENDADGKYAHLKEEYNELTKKIMDGYESKIGDVLNKVEDSWEGLDISSLSPQEAATRSDSIMEDQPWEIKTQTEAINNVFKNGSPEQKKALTEAVNDAKKDIEEVYNKMQTIDKNAES